MATVGVKGLRQFTSHNTSTFSMIEVVRQGNAVLYKSTIHFVTYSSTCQSAINSQTVRYCDRGIHITGSVSGIQPELTQLDQSQKHTKAL